MPDNLTIDAKRDDFSTESPVRAFTDFQVAGNYAIGKGFRPALAHLARYLDAMERKEGWALVQIIEAANPTIIFVKLTINAALPPLIKVDPYVEMAGSMLGDTIIAAPRQIGMKRELGMGYSPDMPKGGPVDHSESWSDETRAFRGLPPKDDPVNPKHYNGRECADIGERLSANAYQVLKYCWRLGKKDDPCQELGKALWYLKSEFDLMSALEGHYTNLHFRPGIVDLDDIDNGGEDFLEKRIADQSAFTQDIARMLWAGYNKRGIYPIRLAIEEHRTRLDCGSGLAV